MTKLKFGRNDVEKLVAGRELDSLVAEYIFGWSWFLCPKRCLVAIFPPENSQLVRWNFSADYVKVDRPDQNLRFLDWDSCCSLPFYSTKIVNAWEIIEKLKLTSYHYFLLSGLKNFWYCKFNQNPHIFGTTEAEVICRCGLYFFSNLT